MADSTFVTHQDIQHLWDRVVAVSATSEQAVYVAVASVIVMLIIGGINIWQTHKQGRQVSELQTRQADDAEQQARIADEVQELQRRQTEAAEAQTELFQKLTTLAESQTNTRLNITHVETIRRKEQRVDVICMAFGSGSDPINIIGVTLRDPVVDILEHDLVDTVTPEAFVGDADPQSLPAVVPPGQSVRIRVALFLRTTGSALGEGGTLLLRTSLGDVETDVPPPHSSRT